MDVSKLMTGIGVVIDDAYGDDHEDREDPIFEIVNSMEDEWSIPFYKTDSIPSESTCDNLLASASFILLDWKLWRGNAPELEKDGIGTNVAFLKKAKEYFVPVFIFTNESPPDLISAIEELDPSLYDEEAIEKNFIFIEQKANLVQNSVFEVVGDWISKNASVYTLKSWERAFYDSKRSLFSSMYERSPDWPRVFWKSYVSDGADPSSSITQLINDSLLGRMRTGILEGENLETDNFIVSRDNIRSLISEACLIRQDYLSEDEIRTGDLFRLSGGRYLINIRPDCDCIARGDSQTPDDVEVYCVKGKKMSDREVRCSYQNGHFVERVSQSIVFALHKGRSIRFDFKQLIKERFAEVRDKRVGRLIHPYITRIQQRYALYLQRQGLPTIPEAAIEDDVDQ